ncbi:MAG: peptidoglycan bridge formation glycyltransferase FemA/FemB family protein, partial [Dehalococcoidia bacterium]|nr:peptidoglycan bridge formation glycyltransferase FemA/FemB family protein [Dehalococcoidia bacterium]
IKERLGWRPYRIIAEAGDGTRAAALVLKRKLPVPGLSIMYVPKGPCFDPEDTGALNVLLEGLTSLARKEGALFLRLDPDLSAEQTNAFQALARAGFRRSTEQVQLRNTMVVDLRPSEEEMLSRMNQSTRRNINLARRNGVEILEGGTADISLFYELYRETAERDSFILRTPEYYQYLWQVFLERGMARAVFARWQGETLAGCLIMHLGKKAWYLLGASRNEMRDVRPNQLIQWEAMRWAKSVGAESYDMWGLPDVLEPGQPMWGLYQFKKGFGGDLRQWAGAFDFVARPVWQRLWLRAFPFYTKLRGGTVSITGGEGAAAGDSE